jgi:hypothetical protein
VVVCDYSSYIVRQDTLILIQIADHAIPTPLLFNIYWMDGSINCSESEACSSHQISCLVLRPAGHPLEQSSSEPPAVQRRSSHLHAVQFQEDSITFAYPSKTSKIKSKGNYSRIIRFTKSIRLVYVENEVRTYLLRWIPARHPRTPCMPASRSLQRTCICFQVAALSI